MKFTELPTACPLCGKAFSSVVRPERKWQKKAVLVFACGVLVTIPWAAACVLGTLYWIETSPEMMPRIRSGRLAALMMIVAAAVVMAPGLLLGSWAMQMPKLVRLRCRHCSWIETFSIDRRG